MTNKNALETKIEMMNFDECCVVARGLSGNLSDEATTVLMLVLNRIEKVCSPESFIAFCDSL